ncbi:MAG: TonB-dependent receptor [Bacteroidia bacterium]|nr:TonB-dependent receptor [Bacteroidia bacterium]
MTSSEDKSPLQGATVIVENTRLGANTDESGQFSLAIPSFPAVLIVSYTGYSQIRVPVDGPTNTLEIKMSQEALELDGVDIIAKGMGERLQQDPKSVDAMSIQGIRNNPSESIFAGLGTMKGVDINGSIGFKVINTRGFNSAAPVRSLQIIDGVDNQSPGLNFSLGNFLGASDLDIQQVEIIQGASSAYYGPNAFNGVISMQTISPFETTKQGFSVSLKGGERNLGEVALRYAKGFGNRNGQQVFAFKVNAYYLTVNDWEANNLNEVDSSNSNQVGVNNFGGYDAVNRYGDENPVRSGRDNTNLSGQFDFPGLGVFHRTGYNETDLVDYGTWNAKLGAAAHWRITKDLTLIGASNFGGGTTILQGDNRYSLKNIRFFQHRVELKYADRGFIRAYATHENAGDSYDAVFTALRLQDGTNDVDWTINYRDTYRGFVPRIQKLPDFPKEQVIYDPVTMTVRFVYDFEKAQEVMAAYPDSIQKYHQLARQVADAGRLVPGTPEFQAAFDDITSRSLLDGGGTRLVDRSALYHIHGEYSFRPTWANITVGGNVRQFSPVTEGTIFSDTLAITERSLPDGSIVLDSVRTKILNREFGIYAGIQKKVLNDAVTLSATVRLDKNQNFSPLVSPALTAVWVMDKNKEGSDIIRASFSSAIRNPTLADQYLYYNVGRAILIGNLGGVDSLVDIDSFGIFDSTLNRNDLSYFNVDPIRPEGVRTFELGYRGFWFDNRVYVDATYYYSFYRDFIGYNLGLDLTFIPGVGIPSNIQPYRVAANARDIVTTQGVTIGMDYYLTQRDANNFKLSGNYSWNVLNTQSDDPIIPAFNTPEHKYNLGFHGFDLALGNFDQLGFSVNYKWVGGFQFEGSPQFTGFVPSYFMVDAQINKQLSINDVDMMVKLGGSNLLNNRIFQIYGGPTIGRLVYLSALFDLN